jgi:hypothetical protein
MTKDYKNSIGGIIEFDTHKFFVVFEGGFAQHDRADQYEYNNKGSFFRTGIDYNLIEGNKEQNVITLGLRYARSSFSDEMSFSRDHYWFGGQDLFYSNDLITAQWMEVVNRLNVRIWKNLYFGSAIRIKLFKSITGQENLVPYDIPGWGRHRKNGTTVKTSNAGFSYYLIWRIPFKG